MPSRPELSSLTPWSWLLPPIGVTAVLWMTRVTEVTAEQVLCAVLLLVLPWGSFLIRRRQKRRGLPVFALVGAAYWWYFAIGLFWLERELRIGRASVQAFQVDDVTGAMWLAFVGVVCLWAGMRVQVPFLAPSRQLELSNHPTTWPYVRLILVAGTLGSVIPGSNRLLGEDGRNIMIILISIVPMVALMLLLRRCLVETEKSSRLDRTILSIYFPIRIVIGLASGWLGSALSLGLVCGAMYLLIRRKLPWTLVALSAAAVLFLQVGKMQFRDTYWNAGTEGSLVEKATFWVNGSASKWSEALNSGSSDSARGLSTETLDRTSLLPQVAHVLDLTPSQVPFQDGQTYSYLAITLIPRFLWPDKPSVNDANHYYQVTFGLSTAKDVNSVNIGVGCLAEAYINFGWSGVVGIMFAIGILLGIYQRILDVRNSSTFILAIGIALLPGIMGIEAQMAAYVGGIIQQVFLTILVFLPVVQRGSAWRLAGQPKPGPAPVAGRLRVRPN
jgi:hypothetical protein